MTKREPAEWVKALIGALMILLTSLIIGLTVMVVNVIKDNAVRDIRIEKVEENQKYVIKSLDKNTDAINDLRVVLERKKDED